MLKLDSINAFYGDVQILYDLSLEVHKNEIVTLLGSNGTGKTTTIKCIFNMLPIRSGSITFDGERLDKRKPHELASLGICLVPEGRKLFPAMSIKDNLLMGAYTLSDKKQIEENLTWVFDMFPRLKERANQSAGTLSGGEQQMCAIGRSLMTRPKFLVFDEPSLGLAPIIVDQIFHTIKTIIKEQNSTVLLIEQNVNIALDVSDRGYVLTDGRISMSGSAKELLASEEIQKAYLGM